MVVLVVRVTPHTLKNQHIQLYSTLTNNPYALLDDFQFDSLGKISFTLSMQNVTTVWVGFKEVVVYENAFHLFRIAEQGKISE